MNILHEPTEYKIITDLSTIIREKTYYYVKKHEMPNFEFHSSIPDEVQETFRAPFRGWGIMPVRVIDIIAGKGDITVKVQFIDAPDKRIRYIPVAHLREKMD